MLPKIFRPRKRTWTLLKFALLFVIACAFVIWYRVGSQESSINEHPGNQIGNKVLDQHGLDQLKEIQDQIINEANNGKVKLDEKKKVEEAVHPVAPPKHIEKEDSSIYDKQIAEDEGKLEKQLGRGGKAVRLSGKEQTEAEEIMKKEAFNLLVSDRIPYNRSLPGWYIISLPLISNLHYFLLRCSGPNVQRRYIRRRTA